jgi:Flp pilus assembly protein TadD
MKHKFGPSVRASVRLCLVGAATLAGAQAWATDAEVIFLLGKAEIRDNVQGAWRPIKVGQQLDAGNFVRTAAGSQVALLLRDQTQIRLNEQSTLLVRAVAAEGQGSTLDLLGGRIWAQVKQSVTGGLRALTKSVNANTQQLVRINTPTATVGIRGTDWELVVGDAGESTVTVFTGEVEMANSLGSVAVAANEQAVAVAGKAPVKSLLTNARDRVQWVTAYRPAPRRWVSPMPAELEAAAKAIESGDYASGMSALQSAPPGTAATLIRADMTLFLGRANNAVTTLQPLAAGGAGDPMATALLGRALIVAGLTDDARTLLTAGIGKHPGHTEIALALADLARLDGDGDVALALFTEVTRSNPNSHEAWFGVGRVQAEKENVGEARRALDEAIRLAPDAPGYYGERATLEALTGNPQTARDAFTQALSRQPDDYLALTGLGILQLKTGDTEAALNSFLKAGTIEPRFARAQLYVGVAYYQLGNRLRALESVRKAAELDPKDPLPYVMLGMMHGDAQELRASIDAAREAQVRMPYLKSLNQVLSNQKGSANVGTALAAQGMEEWAHSYAVDYYNPYWAGSALFLADRYPDGYNKNSELYRGFLLDPTVFGASNRFSSLVPTPGHYGSIGLRSTKGDFNQNSLQVALNGLSNTAVPLAYSLIAEGAAGQADPHTFKAHGQNFTLGLGMKPTNDLGLFYFGTHTSIDGHYVAAANPAAASLTNDILSQQVARQDLGASYRINPTNEVMVKFGQGRQSTDLAGTLSHASQAASLNTTFGAIPVLLPFTANGTLDTYATTVDQTDVQFRHAFDLRGGTKISWGLEKAKDIRTLDYVRTFGSNVAPLFPARLASNANRELESTDAYVSARFKPTPPVELQADMVHQHFAADTRLTDKLDLVGIGNLLTTPTLEHNDFSENNPRLGLAYAPTSGQKLRVVYQRWRHTAGTGSLGPVDTVGIPVEDRLVEAGGLLRRARVQYDWQTGSDSFLQAFADRRLVTTLQSATTSLFKVFGVEELDSLRARKPVFGEPFDDLEKTPTFSQGSVSSIGLAGNWLLSPTLTLAARYTHSSSNNTSVAFAGNDVPYIPRNFANVAGFYQIQGSWLLGVSGSYRSARFADEANSVGLNPGWVFGISSFWETDDKRWTVEAGLGNLHPANKSSVERKPRLVLNGVYRF